MQKLLFICNDFIGTSMAGPGIRCWEMAHALARKGYKVAILAKHVESKFSPDCLAFLGNSSFCNLFAWIRRSDCIVQTGRPIPILLSLLFRKKMIFDQYDPVIFEFLAKETVSVSESAGKTLMLFLWKIRQRILLRIASAFLVANEKQKDFLIGQLAVLGYLRKLDSVTVFPFGLPDVKPTKTRSVLREIKIKNSDFLLVWGGGIWDWFDPFTLLEALSKIQLQRDDIKTYFPGLVPPNPDSRKMAVVESFLAEARRLDLIDKTIFVNIEWTPYEHRAEYLLEADAGVSLHKNSLETRFAFRTRMLDYLWAGLPIISSKGDCWADCIETQGMGITVPTGDVAAVVTAILRMADDPSFRERCKRQVIKVATGFEWNRLIDRLQFD